MMTIEALVYGPCVRSRHGYSSRQIRLPATNLFKDFMSTCSMMNTAPPASRSTTFTGLGTRIVSVDRIASKLAFSPSNMCLACVWEQDSQPSACDFGDFFDSFINRHAVRNLGRILEPNVRSRSVKILKRQTCGKMKESCSALLIVRRRSGARVFKLSSLNTAFYFR